MVLVMSGGFTLLDEHLRKLVTLLLATHVCAQTFLEKLERSLILGDTQQFHGSTFEWSKAGNLTHHASDEFVVLGQTLQEK